MFIYVHWVLIKETAFKFSAEFVLHVATVTKKSYANFYDWFVLNQILKRLVLIFWKQPQCKLSGTT